jgi:hypothetical protein
MAQLTGSRTTSTTDSEGRLVRQVADEIGLLEPNTAPLLTMLNRLKKRMSVKTPRYEWYEDDYVARWATMGAAAANNVTGSNVVTVVDGTMFVPGDCFVVPKAVSSSAAPEICRVVSIAANALTVIRDVGGVGADTIPANGALRLIGSAYEESGAIPAGKSTSPVKKITYTQIFRNTCEFSKTTIASETYGAPGGERQREHKKKLIEHKIQMNSALLFGEPSESLSGGPGGRPIRTTMGLNYAIQSNVTDAGGTLTRKLFEAFARQAFRYGNQTKLLLCAPLVKSAINDWARDFLLVKPGETKYGVKVQQVDTGHGSWLLANDWMLENGVSGQNGFGGMAFSIDVDQMKLIYLSNNGMNRDTKLTEDKIQDGRDGVVDEILTEAGFKIEQEKYHAKLFDVLDYQS